MRRGATEKYCSGNRDRLKKCRGFILAAFAVLAFAALQSWSRPDELRPWDGRKISVGTQKDTIKKAADSVRTHYQEMVDSLAGLNLSMDSLRRMGLEKRVLFSIDSIYKADSIASIIIYTPKEKRQMHRDSVRAYKDSVLGATPRVLNTYVFPDSVINTRLFMWKHNTYVNSQELMKLDTSFNYHFFDLPFYKNDVNAQYLGTSGSAALPFNYFKREHVDVFPFFDVQLPYTYTPETMPFYNVKTPYTELAYWGTQFATKEKEEDNVKFLHTQNFTPSFNFQVMYQRFGTNGILTNEKTDFRTFTLTGNYLGKRYVAQGGYIFSRLKRNENGGVSDISMVTDTTVDAKTIPVYLSDASSVLRRNTFFITHTYGLPINLFARKDSLGHKIDTLKAGEGTITYFGHYGEFSTYSRSYTDAIATTDSTGRSLYNNKFYINPTATFDSVRVRKLENRFFIKMQPWSKDAIVSNLNGGIGHQMLKLYGFQQDYFLTGHKDKNENDLYAYFGAEGKFRKYFLWNALGKIDFAGYYKGNYTVDAMMKFSSWKIKDGIHFIAKFHSSLKTPSYYYDHYYSNHYQWDNDFGKISETKIEAVLQIPHWNMEASFGYALLNKNIYLDTLGIPQQNNSAMSVINGYISKNFKLGLFHFDNKVLFQISSDDDVLPLPKLALNLRYYAQFYAVKNVLNVQIGANITYYSKYYAQAYSPALGMFFNQKDYKTGQCPYIDAFLNLQWKRACIFVKYENAAMGWPKSDYFSAYRYLRPQHALKFGLFWPFYIR